jgi:5-methylcytosine-specific restriction endonuclease McrA
MIRRPLRPSIKPIVRRTPLKRLNVERKRKRVKGYVAHLRSRYFRRLRMDCFVRDRFTCQTCGRTKPPEQLRADHLTYRRFGHELVSDLTTKCVTCHDWKDGWKWKGLPKVVP